MKLEKSKLSAIDMREDEVNKNFFLFLLARGKGGRPIRCRKDSLSPTEHGQSL